MTLSIKYQTIAFTCDMPKNRKEFSSALLLELNGNHILSVALSQALLHFLARIAL